MTARGPRNAPFAGAFAGAFARALGMSHDPGPPSAATMRPGGPGGPAAPAGPTPEDLETYDRLWGNPGRRGEPEEGDPPPD